MICQSALKIRILIIGAASILVLIAAGCAPAPFAAPEATSPSVTEFEAPTQEIPSTTEVAPTETVPTIGGTLIYANPQKARSDSMDPATQSGLPGGQVVWLLYDRLVYYDTAKGAQPDLATSWEVSPDGLSYIFHLRDDVTFHDGTELNADAVKFTFDRIAREDMAGQQAANYLQPVYESSEVLDDHTVRINLVEPSPEFLYQISRQVFGIISPTAVQEMGDEVFALNPVGSGPYMFKEIVSGDHVTLIRNADYAWGPDVFSLKGPAYPDEVIFRYISEPTTRLAALETGEVNFIEDVPLQEIERLQNDSSIHLYANAHAGMTGLIQLNLQKWPTSELAVRQAIQFSLNKGDINQAIFFGLSEPSYSLLAPGTLGYDASIGESMYSYDPDRARQLLEDGGWVLGSDGIYTKDGKPLELVFVTDTKSQLEELVQAQLLEVGMSVDIQRLDPAGAAEAWKNNEQNMTLGNGGLYGRSNPSGQILGVNFTCAQLGAFNATGYCSEEFDALMAEANATQDDAERAAKYQDLQRILQQESVAVPLYAYTKFWGASSDVQGIINWDAGGVYIRLNGVWIQQ